jgi:hypothetical protein
VVERIPPRDEILVRQGLPPFGETVSRYTYVRDDDALRFSGENLTRITYKGFPVVGPKEMTTNFLLIRESDYLLVYGAGGARVFNFLGLLSGVIENSFTSRTTGLFDWYSKNYLDPLREGELGEGFPQPPAPETVAGAPGAVGAAEIRAGAPQARHADGSAAR